MGVRPGWLWLLCLALTPGVVAQQPPTAESLWDLGQDAMRRGEPDQAIRFYERSLAADPHLTRNHLSLAAARLELGDDPGACAHLSRYVAANPDQLLMRVHLADLLLRLKRTEDARTEFERCVARAQERDDPGSRHLIHCHTRLMEIAESGADGYGEHLNRGIGLYHLAVQRAALQDPDDELAPEALLCKAAGELTLAQMDRPDDARPAWYLHEVWSRLAQRKPALRCLHAAVAAAPFSHLTAAEQRSIQLASECMHVERSARCSSLR